jgi:hypothetical protein
MIESQHPTNGNLRRAVASPLNRSAIAFQGQALANDALWRERQRSPTVWCSAWQATSSASLTRRCADISKALPFCETPRFESKPDQLREARTHDRGVPDRVAHDHSRLARWSFSDLISVG